jgi:hypothetical protein
MKTKYTDLKVITRIKFISVDVVYVLETSQVKTKSEIKVNFIRISYIIHPLVFYSDSKTQNTIFVAPESSLKCSAT